MNFYKRILIISILCFIAFGLFFSFAPLEPMPKAGLSILIVIAGLWFTEALPIPVTALLIPVFATLLGVGSLSENLAPFASPVVFLVFGGCMLSIVLHTNGLDRWFAAQILKISGVHTGKILIGIFLITGFLSMWMSNASAALMMLPIVLSILAGLPEDSEDTKIFALLGVAYSAGIGGTMSLVGSPTNIIVAGQLNLDFFGWLKTVTPAALVFFPLMIGAMILKLKPKLNENLVVNFEVPELNQRQKLVLLIFVLTCFSWVFSSYLGSLIGITHHMDTWIILSSMAVFFVLGLVKWDAIEEHTQWGVLILSGGGMALSVLLQETGAGTWLALNVIDRLVGESPILFVIVSVIFLILVTEVMSNAAAAALSMPILLVTTQSLNLPPEILALVVGISVNMAFMFPIATPPNAIVYGTGLIPMKKMISTGLILNILGVVFICGYVLMMKN